MTASEAMAAVASLVTGAEMRHRGGVGAAYTVRAPSRMTMLREAIATGMESGGGSGVPGSRPTICAPAMDLWIEIEQVVERVGNGLGLSRVDTAPGTHGEVVWWPARMLREAVVAAEDRGLTATAEMLGDAARRWVQQIDRMLLGERSQWPARHVSCVDCAQMWVFDWDPAALGEVRRPAVMLTLDEAGARHLVCQACGSVAEIPDLTDEPPAAPVAKVVPPTRSRLSRVKGWKMPDGTVMVSRPSRYSNPFSVRQALADGWTTDRDQAQESVVLAFGHWLAGGMPEIEPKRRDRLLADLHRLRGKHLACWCKPDQPCHADVLIELANAPETEN